MRETVCLHPPEMVRHIGHSIHQCFNCGHTSYLVGRPYFCSKCPDVHSKTFEEITKHRNECHAQEQIA